MANVSFHVDFRLAALLSENYRLMQDVILELVNNAWNADAENVWITLPTLSTEQPILVRDDGCGMTAEEFKRGYLVIDYGPRHRQSETTLGKRRRVRGHGGVGKFAGLAAAELMHIETRSRGQCSTLLIKKSSLPVSEEDLANVDLPLNVDPCDPNDHGTTINLSHPIIPLEPSTTAALREMLALVFGRSVAFTIAVNGEKLTPADIKGKSILTSADFAGAGYIVLQFTIFDSQKKVRQPGIVTRLGGRIVGKPSYMGLESDDEIPPSLLRRVVGEIEADWFEGCETTDGCAQLKKSAAYHEVQKWAGSHIRLSLSEVFAKEFNLVKARHAKKLNELLAKLPEYRRSFASRAIDSVFRKFFAESEEKIDVLISLVLKAFEQDDYWTVCRKIDEASPGDVSSLAAALGQFGLVDLIHTAEQARRRLQVLDKLESLARDRATLESTMHKALETNLWVLGRAYGYLSSNKALSTTIEMYLGERFGEQTDRRRPDLFLGRDYQDKHLLIEFKRPSHAVDRDDVTQAEKYRDYLTTRIGPMDILIIGGSILMELVLHPPRDDITLRTYFGFFSEARTQWDWVVSQLRASP